jgi:predicted restriction endonuclease
MSDRKYILASIRRALLEETIYRRASCLSSIERYEDDDTFFRFDEKAHINPHSKTEDDSFDNLITLCPNCHTKFDKMKDKIESLKRLRNLKMHWLGISGKYSKLEIDCLLGSCTSFILQYFFKTSFTEM